MKLNKDQILYLSDAEVEALVPAKQVLKLTEDSFREYALGRAVNPIKLHLPIYPDYEGYINSMPAYLRKLQIAGAKLVSVYRDNPAKHQLPSTIGTVVLCDPQTGKPYAIMGGTYITAARTGAVMGVMAKYTVRKDAQVLTVVGAGAQGFSAFLMIKLAIGTISTVRLVDINPASCRRFAERAVKAFPDVTCIDCGSIQEACRGADVVLAAATSEKPLLADIAFDKGTTVLIIEEDFGNSFVKKFDGFVGDFRECLVERINADSRHHCEVTGEPFEELTMESVTSEIGDIIVGKDCGRRNDSEIILGASVGMGIQDIIVGHEAFERAIECNRGTVLPM